MGLVGGGGGAERDFFWGWQHVPILGFVSAHWKHPLDEVSDASFLSM